MRYSGIIFNDMTAAPGLCVTFFSQGCPHRCIGCHNPESWDFQGGKEFTIDTLNSIIEGLQAQDLARSLCIMGGEPLCPENAFLTYFLISQVKSALPYTPIYIWTGYTLDDLLKHKHPRVMQILKLCDYLIDGPYIAELRDITLPMRGSSNQRVINMKDIDLT